MACGFECMPLKFEDMYHYLEFFDDISNQADCLLVMFEAEHIFRSQSTWFYDVLLQLFQVLK